MPKVARGKQRCRSTSQLQLRASEIHLFKKTHTPSIAQENATLPYNAWRMCLFTGSIHMEKPLNRVFLVHRILLWLLFAHSNSPAYLG